MLGCAAPLPEPRQVTRASDLDEARAATILEVHRQASAGAPDGPDLGVGAEPGADLTRVLEAVEGRGPRIWAASRCTVRDDRMVEAISGRSAVEVTVESVEITGPGFARSKAGWVNGKLSGEGRELTLEFRLGHWVAVSSKPTWIS